MTKARRCSRLGLACLLSLAAGACARGSVADEVDASSTVGNGTASDSADAGYGGQDWGSGDGDGAGDGLDDGSDDPQAGIETPDSSAGGGGDAGSNAPPDDPPVAARLCKPGTYVGSFNGSIQIIGLISLPISGDLTIVGLTSSSGDYLTIDNGKIDGQDENGNPVTADVVGTMNCITYQLEGGALKNGVYVRKDLNQTVNFEGTADATYNPVSKPPSVTGTWATESALESGSGTFNALLME